MSKLLSALKQVLRQPHPIRFLCSRTLLRMQIPLPVVVIFSRDPEVKLHLSANPVAHNAWLTEKEPLEMRIFKEHIEKDAVVLDVGANVGTHTLYAARLATEGRVIAFEPGTRAERALVRNLQLNRVKNVTVYNAGVSSIEGKWKLEQPGRSDEQSFLAPATADEGVIATVRLDSVLQEHQLETIDFLKIDVEGAELRVLESLGDRVVDVRKIFFENLPEAMGRYGYNQTDLYSWFIENNFTVYSLVDGFTMKPTSSLEDASANVLAIR